MGDLTVIIPTYNESGVILQTIRRIESELADLGFEILVVDDDSPDGTWEIVRDAHGDNDAVQVIRRCNDRGLGTAVLRGIEEARTQYCIVADADLQHPPRYIRRLYSTLTGNADLVIGSRYVPGGSISGWSRSRLLVSLGAVAIARTLIPEARPVRDPISGFFGLETSIINAGSFRPKGYKILLEIIVRGEYDRLKEVPFTFEGRKAGASKFDLGQYRKFLQLVASLTNVRERSQSSSNLLSRWGMPQSNQHSSEEHG